MTQTQRLSKNNTQVWSDDDPDGWMGVRLHNTNVVRWNGIDIVLSSGGWRTPTTKTRMNQASNEYGLGYQVYQKDFVWRVVLPNGTDVPFEDGMRFPRRSA